MKKEELFDLLEDVDRKYINEAMFDDLDGDSPAVARPGKAKISPLKIIAPIAACLAVVIGTGAVVSRLNKPEQSNNSEQQTTQQQIDPNAFVQVDFRDKDLMAEYESNTFELNFEPEDDIECEFLAECINIIKDEYESTRQDDVSWKVNKGYALSWGRVYGYYIQPQIDGQGIAEVGVRAFHKTKGYSSVYGETFDIWDHKSFGQGYEGLDLDQVINHFDYDDKYYYRTDTIGSGESTSLRQIYLKGNEDELAEKTLLEKYVDGDTVTYLHEGKKISEEEFIGIWNTYPFIPKFYTDFTNEEVEECREALKESLGLGDDWHDCWRDSEIDIDLDGTKELLLSPQECDNRATGHGSMGTYVFARTSDGIKQVGSFATEDPYFNPCYPEEVRYRNVSATERFAYYSTHSIDITNSSYATDCLLKIIPDGNGGVTTEMFAGIIHEHDDNWEWTTRFEWFGEEVSEEEFCKAYYDYRDNCIDHKYHKPSVPTDPDNYAWD